MAASAKIAIRSAGKIKEISAGYLAYALLMLLAAAHFLTTDWQLQVARELISCAKQAWMIGDAEGIAEAAVFAGAAAGWY